MSAEASGASAALGRLLGELLSGSTGLTGSSESSGKPNEAAPGALGALVSLASHASNNPADGISARINDIIDEVSREETSGKATNGDSGSSVAGGAEEKGAVGSKSLQNKRRAALLRALKPYLAPARADAIDKLLVITELGDIFGGR